MPMRFRLRTTTFVAALAAVATSPELSLAHHMMGGEMPATFFDGLLSGLAHPVIELPHLAAILLAGVLAARLERPAWIMDFVVGSFLGTAALALELPLVPNDTLVAATSLLLVGLVFLRSPVGKARDALLLFAIGVVHGMAFAEAIVGAEATPIAAYLLGLAIAELVLAGMTAVVTLRIPALRVRASNEIR